jgi:hypothetical protein
MVRLNRGGNNDSTRNYRIKKKTKDVPTGLCGENRGIPKSHLVLGIRAEKP